MSSPIPAASTTTTSSATPAARSPRSRTPSSSARSRGSPNACRSRSTSTTSCSTASARRAAELSERLGRRRGGGEGQRERGEVDACLVEVRDEALVGERDQPRLPVLLVGQRRQLQREV